MKQPGADVTLFPVYHALRDFVALAVSDAYTGQEPPQGCQFLIARNTGHDESHDPDYLFLSPFVPMGDAP